MTANRGLAPGRGGYTNNRNGEGTGHLFESQPLPLPRSSPVPPPRHPGALAGSSGVGSGSGRAAPLAGHSEQS
jgi:hypothetical protein